MRLDTKKVKKVPAKYVQWTIDEVPFVPFKNKVTKSVYFPISKSDGFVVLAGLSSTGDIIAAKYSPDDLFRYYEWSQDGKTMLPCGKKVE